MYRSLYQSRPWSSCFEGEDAVAAVLAANAAAAANSAAATAAAAAANTGAGDKSFSQDDVNRIMAEDKRKHQVQLQKVEQQLTELAKSKTLTDQERSTLKENLDAIAGQLRTKEQQAQLEKRQMEEAHALKMSEADQKAHAWEALYRDSTVDRSLQDAAVKHEAFNTGQIVTQLKPWTRLIEVMDDKTGKGTSKYQVVVEMPDVDPTTGQPVPFTGTPEEAVKRMKEMPDQWGNLFKSGVVSGIGSSSATGGLIPGQSGKIDVRKLTPAQYREIRAKNPELLGLAPKHR